MPNFKEISVDNFHKNPFELIGKDWMLITAKKGDKINTMTASWGGFGYMWNKNVAYIVVRPQRYTKEFIEYADTFSLTFFDESYRKTLNYLGKTSGRDENKIEISKLTSLSLYDTPYFEEANTVIFCKKLYAQDLKPECFIQKELNEKWYPLSDHHTLYIVEITNIFESSKG